VIRSSSGFELTLQRAQRFSRNLNSSSKIEGLVVPSVFDPKRERSNFRISGPDNVLQSHCYRTCAAAIRLKVIR